MPRFTQNNLTLYLQMTQIQKYLGQHLSPTQEWAIQWFPAEKLGADMGDWDQQMGQRECKHCTRRKRKISLKLSQSYTVLSIFQLWPVVMRSGWRPIE